MALKPTALSVQKLTEICLDHLARNPDQLAEFMVQSGLDPASLRELVGTAGFAHGLIDYVASNEPLLLAVATENNLKPESIVSTWAKLHRHEA